MKHRTDDGPGRPRAERLKPLRKRTPQTANIYLSGVITMMNPPRYPISTMDLLEDYIQRLGSNSIFIVNVAQIMHDGSKWGSRGLNLRTPTLAEYFGTLEDAVLRTCSLIKDLQAISYKEANYYQLNRANQLCIQIAEFAQENYIEFDMSQFDEFYTTCKD